MGKNDILAIGIMLFFVFSVVSQFVIYQYVNNSVEEYEESFASGKASAQVSLCFNSVPVINISSCGVNISQSQTYSCQVNATDYNANTTFTFSSINLTEGMPFNISTSGVISFTPNQTYVGNHSMNITVYDNTGCSNGYDSDIFNYSIIDVNDPPIWIANISDQEIDDAVLVIALDLDDYAYDPDGDELEFIPVGSAVGLNITVLGGNRLSFYASSCLGQVYPIWIVAGELNTSDMYATSSNFFTVTINCASGGSSEDDTSSGGGGGGGSSRTCEPDWQCSKWGPCIDNGTRPNGTQIKRCIDYNGCDADNYVRFAKQSCELPPLPTCQENWVCSAWDVCYINPETGITIQNKTCVDTNSCGTHLNEPNSTQSCTIEQPLNQTTTPDVIVDDEFPWLTYILIIAIILAGILIIVYKLYKKQIREAMVRLIWYITKKRRKEILISDEIKDKLLKEILTIEQKIGKTPLDHSAFKLAETSRKYFAAVYKLTHEFTTEQFEIAFKKKKLDSIITKILKSFADLTYNIQFKKYKMLPYETLTFIDELRLIIFQTSNATRQDGEKQIKSRKTASKNKIDIIYTQISNSLLPTQFNESVYGKKSYLIALRTFEQLTLSEQQRVYPYIYRLFEEINYVSHLVKTAKLT